MNNLSSEQKRRIEAMAEDGNPVKIAKSLRLDSRIVKEYLDTLAQMRRQRRERIYRLLMFAIPLLFFIALETILSVIQYGGKLSLFVPSETIPGYMSVNENVGRRYFSSSNVLPETSHDGFRATKTANTYRIFVMGGSTAAGYPFMYNGSMSKMLYRRLLDYFPDRDIEVVNLAMPAINSFSLLDFTKEALAQRPDLLIIYAGHNEFYGALGVGSTESLGRWRWTINLYLRLQRLRTMLFLREQVENVKKWFQKSEQGGGSTLMEQMVSDQEIAYQNPKYQRARQFFHANLEDIVRAARRQGVQVLLSTLVSNVRDQKPFVSIYSPGTSEAKFREAMMRAIQLHSAGNFAEAIAVYDSLLAIDKSPAVLHFLLGKSFEAKGDFDAARAAYRQARDRDGLRFRASADFNQVIQMVAQENGVPVVEMETAFEQDSPHGLVGNNLMVEHLHPNVRGYFLMGRELCKSLRDNGLIAAGWDDTGKPTEDEYWQNRGVTALDDEIARLRIAVLTHNWPFVTSRRWQPLHYQPQTSMQKLAYATWKREITWEKAHVLLAEDFAKRGELGLAVQEYEAIIQQTPYNVSPYLRAGLLYTKLEHYDRAYDRLVKSIALEPSAEAYKVVGAILLNRGEKQKGAAYLQQALRLEPNDPQTLYNLTGAYILLGQTENALTILTRLEELSPGSDKIRELQRSLASAQSAKLKQDGWSPPAEK